MMLLKDDGVKSAALSMPADLENSAVTTGLSQFSSQSQRKAMNVQTTTDCTHFTC